MMLAQFFRLGGFVVAVVVLSAPLGGATEEEWVPEWREWWANKRLDERSARAAVRAELARSLEVYRSSESLDDAAAYVSRVLREERREDFVVVLGNRIYVDRSFLGIDKNNRHLQLVASVAKVRHLPNVAYLVNRFAFGDRHPYPLEAPHDRGACYSYGGASSSSSSSSNLVDPELVIAKAHGYRQCGVLIPNMYYLNELGKWNATSRALRPVPWAEKRSRAFWRGQILAQPKCHRDFGNHARWEALALARTYPEDFDCDCLEGKPCDFRNASRFPCPRLPYDATIEKLHKEPRSRHSKKALTVDKFSQYKFHLNVPGTISGSYSRHLNVLWMLKSVVLLWNSPHVEWYYPSLQGMVTHVPVSRATAKEALDALRADDAKARELANAARLVHDVFLCADCVADYFLEVLTALQRHFQLDSLFDDDTEEEYPRSRKARTALFDDLTSGTRNLVEVAFSATPDLGDLDDDDNNNDVAKIKKKKNNKPAKSIPFLFLRPVRAFEDRLQPAGPWQLTDWKPGRGLR